MSETVRVRRGGSYLTIPVNAVDRYMAKGYDVVNDNGDVLKASVPNDINALKRAYAQHLEEIAELKAEIAQLKARKSEKQTTTETAEPKKSTAKSKKND